MRSPSQSPPCGGASSPTGRAKGGSAAKNTVILSERSESKDPHFFCHSERSAAESKDPVDEREYKVIRDPSTSHLRCFAQDDSVLLRRRK